MCLFVATDVKSFKQSINIKASITKEAHKGTRKWNALQMDVAALLCARAVKRDEIHADKSPSSFKFGEIFDQSI
jgi:hypothetical protein